MLGVSYLGPPDLPFPSGHGESLRMQLLLQAGLMSRLKVLTCVRTANMGTHFCA